MSFPWSETRQQLEALGRCGPLRVAADRRSIEALGADGRPLARVRPPVCLPIGHADAAGYAASLPAELGVMLVLLLRAGAAAAGVWREDEMLRHKVIKKYVVRGHGKAQTTYRKTRGKSRAGSRLRLRNAESLLEDLNDKLAAWQAEVGAFERVLFYAPARQWGDVFRADPPPPFAVDNPRLVRIPLHVHEPGHQELLRVRRLVTRGFVEECGLTPAPEDA